MGIFTRFFWIATNLQANSRNDGSKMSLRACGAGAKALRRRQRSNPVQYSKKAFTLAEIMIVLAVIGVLTAILLPTARQITPDENVIKFKKAHNTLYSVIRELVTSDKYYLDGDLSIKFDGTRILGGFSPYGGNYTTDENLIKYFCTSIADVVSTKNVNCSTLKTGGDSKITVLPVSSDGIVDNFAKSLEECKTRIDETCALDSAKQVGAEITLHDDVIFYQANPSGTFGIAWELNGDYPLFKDKNSNGMYYVYKPFCIDIDGIDKGEDPFGYGIRIDGKIFNGARADAWLTKSIQGDN